MSAFSEKCRALLLENGSNVYKLSNSSSLERTSLQRMITGKRLPHLDFVNTFCDALRIPASEKSELLELYAIESMGETAYKNQQCILNLFSQLADLEDSRYKNTCCMADISGLKLCSNISEESYNTEMLLRFVLEKEFSSSDDGYIYTNLPGTNTLFLHNLESLYQLYKSPVKVRQLIYFQVNPAAAHENLAIFGKILPLCLSVNLDYIPCYYYSRLTTSDWTNMLFPYYLITSKYVLQISHDLQKGILHSDPQIVRQYTDVFSHTLDMTAPLFRTVHAPEFAVQAYLDFSRKADALITTLESGPCHLDMLSPDIFLRLVSEHTPEYMPFLEKYVTETAKLTGQPRRSFFTERGFSDFCLKGKYSGTPNLLFPPPPLPLRVKSLKHYISSYDCSTKIMLKDTFRFPETLFLEMHGSHDLCLIRLADKKEVTFINIQESSICEAFFKFFQILPESKYAFGSEETQGIIKSSTERLSDLCEETGSKAM